ncbi:MAG: hypothetical protein ABGY96_22675 [bacterium]
MTQDNSKDKEERRTGVKERRVADDRRGPKRVVTVTTQRRKAKADRREK